MRTGTNLAPRIAQLVRLLLGSDQPGEVVAAAAALNRTLGAAGLDRHDFADGIEAGLQAMEAEPATDAPHPHRDRDPDFVSWRAMVDYCLLRDSGLSDRERDFLQSLRSWRGAPTTKQIDWLSSIYNRLKGGRR